MADRVSAAVTYTTAGGTFVLGMTANEFAALGGLAVAVLAYITNAGIAWWFQHQRLKLDKQKAGIDE